MLSSAAVLVVVATIGAVVLRHVATSEAVQDARSVTVAFGHGVLRHQITSGVLDGDPAAVAALDRAVHQRVLGAPIVRVKVWTPDGRVVYSDASELIGRRFARPDDLRASLRDNAVRAEVSNLSHPENRLERSSGKLVEVYLPLKVADGRRVLVEAYHPAGSIDAGSHRIWRTFLPLLVALLVALAAAQLPLAWWHTRRGRAEARERARLARETESALQLERGRIATELHDGVVQDLAGLSFSLAAAADRATARGAVESSDILDRAAASARRAVRQMRSLLVDIYPPNLHTVGLESALRDLLSPLQAQGIDSKLEVAPDLRLAPATERLLFVTAREAIRNVSRHADASEANIRVATDGTRVELVVADDGRGFPAQEVLAKGPNGHLGLALLTDLAKRAGGDLAVVSRQGHGTRLTLGVPSA
jgi:signal transduction histidine kinase